MARVCIVAIDGTAERGFGNLKRALGWLEQRLGGFDGFRLRRTLYSRGVACVPITGQRVAREIGHSERAGFWRADLVRGGNVDFDEAGLYFDGLRRSDDPGPLCASVIRVPMNDDDGSGDGAGEDGRRDLPGQLPLFDDGDDGEE